MFSLIIFATYLVNLNLNIRVRVKDIRLVFLLTGSIHGKQGNASLWQIGL